jgi:glutamine synthetase
MVSFGASGERRKKGLTDSPRSTQTVAEEQVPDIAKNERVQFFHLQFIESKRSEWSTDIAEVQPWELEHYLSIC